MAVLKIIAGTTQDKVYLIGFLDDPGRLYFIYPLRATRLRREPYDDLGA